MSTIDVREQTIYSVLTHADTRPRAAADWVMVTLLGCFAWFGAAGYLGQFRDNDVARALHTLAPGNVLLALSVAGALMIAAFGALRGRRSLVGGGLVVAAFLLGNVLYGSVTRLIPGGFEFPFTSSLDAVAFSAERLAWGACLVLPMLAVWRLGFGRGSYAVDLTLGWGVLRSHGRYTNARRPPESWFKLLFGGYALFCVVALLFMQLPAEFAPFRTGAIWPLLPGILLAAVANSTAEEYIFRGLVQPALVRVGGIGAGLWAQGALFGLMHWGLGAGVLAALPVSLALGFGSVVWGKAALDTRGMGWVIIAHAMVDVAIMCALFVPVA